MRGISRPGKVGIETGVGLDTPEAHRLLDHRLTKQFNSLPAFGIPAQILFHVRRPVFFFVEADVGVPFVRDVHFIE